MSTVRKRILSTSLVALVAASGFVGQAQAALILNDAITASFTVTTTNTIGNDLPGRPSSLYFGQLLADQAGLVDFFYVGHEAGYTNALMLNGAPVNPTWGLPDNFNAAYHQVGSTLAVTANSLLNFGFCTDGGNSVPGYGKCAYNNSAASLTAQFNYGGVGHGYRSIALRPLTTFDPTTGAFSFSSSTTANDWMLFWDDSGAKNDDDHDDYIAVARFRPVSVPEPGTALLLGMGLLATGLTRFRKRA
jgi:hypothetical protein